MNTSRLLDLAPAPRLRTALAESSLFAPAAPIVVARAPGRLDVMGGIADYTGSVVCEMPLSIAAVAAAQARDDLQIVCRSVQTQRTVSMSVGQFLVGDPLWIRNLFDKADAWARYPAGCAWWLLRQDGSLRRRVRGVTILIDSDVPLGGGVSSSAAIEVATMSALAALWSVSLAPLRLAVACQEVENRVVGAPCGVMDQVTSALGEQASMLELLCQTGGDGLPAQVLGQVHVPEGYAFVGVHSGVHHEVSGDPYTDTRVAAFIAQKILEVEQNVRPDGGHLANIAADNYQRRLRATLPETLAGQAFIDRYGKTNDAVTTVRPTANYPVRAAADHHVLEMARVRRFIDLLKDNSGDPAALDRRMTQSGGLMIESHHSYGQCAHLGHAMTDKLVEMVQALGPAQGFYGAKITGGGGGGTVAILIRDRPKVRQRVNQLREQYTRDTGRPTMLFDASGPGCAALGTASIGL